MSATIIKSNLRRYLYLLTLVALLVVSASPAVLAAQDLAGAPTGANPPGGGISATPAATGAGAQNSPGNSSLSISAGDRHTCAVKSDGTVVCWGDNTSGKASPPSGTFFSASAGRLHSCGVRSDSTVACWGDNDSGESTPPSGTFSSVSAGGAHSCGVRSNGTVACWGSGGFFTPRPVPSPRSARAAPTLAACGPTAPRRAWWSTSWRCGRTTPGTGRSRAPARRSSSSTCVRCSTCRSATRALGRRGPSWPTCWYRRA